MWPQPLKVIEALKFIKDNVFMSTCHIWIIVFSNKLLKDFCFSAPLTSLIFYVKLNPPLSTSLLSIKTSMLQRGHQFFNSYFIMPFQIRVAAKLHISPPNPPLQIIHAECDNVTCFFLSDLLTILSMNWRNKLHC